MADSKSRRCFLTFLEYVQECDLFAPNILLRYKNDTQFKTLTSAVLSITLVVFFVIVFANRFLSTVNRENVSIQTAFIESMDPTLYSINTSQFMFVVGLDGINLTNSKKYFDITITQWSFQNGIKSTRDIGMQPCTLNHWSNYGQQFSQRYESLGMSQWLCPTPNQSLDMQGKFSSSAFKLLKVGVSKCTGSNCASDAQIQAHLSRYKTFKVLFYYTKTVLNPQSFQPVSMTLDDSVYLQFSLTLGSTSNLFFEGYTISTDYSLTPKEDNQIVSGITTSLNPQIRAYSVIDAPNTEYASIFVRKSPKSRSITRSYEKYDMFLSYIGGLFGLISIALGVPLYYYNLCCYELTLATNMFTYKKTNPQQADSDNLNGNDGLPAIRRKSTLEMKEEQEQSLKHSVSRFNFIVFLGFMPYQALRLIGAAKTKCDIFRPYYEAIRQVRKQIDIGKILQKLTYYDRMSKSILDQHQRNLLHIYTRENISEVARERSKYKLQKTANMAASQHKPQPPVGMADILNVVLQEHIKPEVDVGRAERDIKLLAMSYEFLSKKQDPNLDPEIIAVLKAEMNERKQVINPLFVDDINDVHLQIEQQINDEEFPHGGSYSDDIRHEQSASNINPIEIEQPSPNNMRRIKSLYQK